MQQLQQKHTTTVNQLESMGLVHEIRAEQIYARKTFLVA